MTRDKLINFLDLLIEVTLIMGVVSSLILYSQLLIRVDRLEKENKYATETTNQKGSKEITTHYHYKE